MAIHHLVGRGIEAARHHGGKMDWNRTVHEIPKPVAGLIFLTIIAYCMLHMYIYYVYGTMMPVLVVTEAPAQTTVIRTSEYRDEPEEEEDSTDKNPDAPLLTKEEKEAAKPVDEEVLVIVHKPITARLRTTIKHLGEKKASRFQGLGGFFIYTMLAGCLNGFIRPVTPGLLSLLRIPLNALLCLLVAAWVQSVVAMPKQRGFFQLRAELRRAGHFKQLFLASMLVETATMYMMHLPRSGAILTAAVDDLFDRKYSGVITASGYALTTFLTVIWLFTLVVPLNIAFVRLSAALLPEEMETVIPIDRTLNMAGVKTLTTAWRSFTRAGYWRLVKTYLKVAVMQFGAGMLLVIVLALELYFGAEPQLANAVDNGIRALRR